VGSSSLRRRRTFGAEAEPRTRRFPSTHDRWRSSLRSSRTQRGSDPSSGRKIQISQHLLSRRFLSMKVHGCHPRREKCQ
jgi:hypothetical protein